MGEELVTVRLLGLPVAIHAETSEHIATLRRELALVELAEASHMGERLTTLAADLRGRFGSFVAGAQGELEAAIAAGQATVDLTFHVPPAAAEAAQQYDALLDEADALCAQGALVTLVTPPDAVAYRRWFLGAFVEQIREQREPRAWDGATAATKEEPAVSADPSAHVEPIVADGDLDLLGAPTLRDEIAERLERGETGVVVDLSSCHFVDSVGLSVLLTARERCVAVGGTFRVIGVTDDVQTLLRTVGVHEILTGEQASPPPPT